MYFLLLFVCGVGLYITYQLNLWGPIIKMTEAASQQAVEEGKRRLREFLEASDTGRQAMAMSGNRQYADEYEMTSGSSFNKDGRRRQKKDEDDDEDEDDL